MLYHRVDEPIREKFCLGRVQLHSSSTMVEGSYLLLISVILFSIAFSTFRLGIGPTSSSLRAIEAMIAIHPPKEREILCDVGAGFGRLLFTLAARHPTCHIIGYELSLLPYLTLQLQRWWWGYTQVTLRRQDIRSADLRNIDIIYCYLYSGAMRELEQTSLIASKAHLISNSFALPNHTPLKVLSIHDRHRSKIYLYKLTLRKIKREICCHTDTYTKIVRRW